MIADIINMNKFVELNNLQEVTNPILLERDNIPTRDGLLSYEIFGRTVEDRTETFAYMDLQGHFLHPLVYKTWRRMDRKIESIVSGIVKVSVKNGELVPDPEKGWTGLDALYAHFNELKFKRKDSATQNERADFLRSLNREEAFCTKWCVIPAFYRDMQLNKSSSGVVTVHEITREYSKLLRLCRSLKSDFSSLNIITNATRNKIQQQLVTLYSDYFIKEIKGKDGMFRKFVMGKSVDYSCRLVISTALFEGQRPSDMKVDFEHVGMPLAATLTCFFPFVIKWLKDYFRNNLENVKDKFPVKVNGQVEYVKLTNIEKYNDEFFTKIIDSFLHSYSDRISTIPLENDKGYDVKMRIIGNMATLDNSNIVNVDSTLNRECTWADLLYMAAWDVTRDKHVLVTRYPLEDYFGIFPCKFNVLSTAKTVPMKIGSRFYPFYPIINTNASKEEVSTMFIDTLSMSNAYLSGLGADFDGDQVTVRGVFAIQSNQSSNEIMYKKQNFLDISCNLKRSTEREAIQTLYQLTADIV